MRASVKQRLQGSRSRTLGRLAAAAAAAGIGASGSARANTQVVVPNGTTDLTLLGAGSASDLTFTNQTYAPTSFSAGSSVTLGTLNDLDATQTLTISNNGAAADAITLSGGGNSVAPSPADLLYVAGGGTLTLNGSTGATALGVTLAASGNFNVAGTANVSSIISGAFAIEKTGTGTLNLTGANSFSGGLTVGAGTVIGDVNGSSLTTTFGAGTITLGDAAIGANAALADAGFGGNTNAITVAAGAGTRTLYSLSILSGQSPTFSGAVTLNSSLTLAANSGGSLRMSGVIADGSGTNSLVINSPGTGVVRLAGANTFGGGVQIQQGILELYTSNTAAGTGAITIGNSTGSANATLLTNSGAITATNPITVASGNTGVATIGNGNGSLTTYSGAVTLNNNLTLNSSGAGGVTLSGAVTGGATATITNAGTSTGTATLSGLITSTTGTIGLVQNSATSQLAITDRVNLSVGSIAIKAGTFYFNPVVGTDGAYNIVNPITLGDATLNANATLNFGYRSGTSAAGTINVLGTGTDTLVFSHYNSGQISILAGAITLNSNTLNLQTTGISGSRINGGVSGTGNLVVNSTAGDTTNGVSLRSAINNTGTITNQGAGTGALGEVSGQGTFGANVTKLIQNSTTSPFSVGNANPAFVGSVEVDLGSFIITNAGGLNANNAVAVASGATVDVQNVAQTIAGLNDVVAGTGGTVTDTTGSAVRILTIGGSGTYNFSGTITAATPADMALTVNMAAAGVQTLNGANSYTGATTVSGGTLRLGNAAAVSNSAVTVNGGTLDLNGNSISSTLAVSGAGAGSNGALVNSNTATPATVSYEITNGASFTVGGAGAITLQRARSGGAPFTLTKVGTGTLTLGNANATGADNLLALDVESASTVNLGMNGTTIAIDRGLKVAAGGTVAFTGTSTSMITSGSEVIISNGTLNINALNSTVGKVTLGDGTNNGTLSGTGTLTISPTYNLFGTNTSGNTSTIEAESGSAAVKLAGAVVLNKTTTGTVVLSGSNTYSGGTLISAGTMRADNAASSLGLTGATTVSNSSTGRAVLAGNGNTGTGAITINGAAAVITAGTGAVAGNAPGKLTTAGQTWTAGSFVDKVVSPAGPAGSSTGYDLLVMSTLSIPGSAFVVNIVTPDGVTAPSIPTGTVVVLAQDLEGGATNPFNTSGGVAPAGLLLQVNGATSSTLTLATQADTISSTGYDLILQASTAAAPEPTSLLLAGIAVAPLTLGRRRRGA